MVVSSKTDLRFPESGQQGHGARIIQNSWICFFPPEPLGSYLKTSYGDIQKTADTLSIDTGSSQYSFCIDNDCLSDGLKEIWKKNMQRVFLEILDQIEKIL